MAPPKRADEAANLDALETERIRASQPEQVPREGGEAKKPLPLISAYIVSSIAFLLPLRTRVRFNYAMNFLHNDPRASFSMAFAWVGMRFTGMMIWLAYHFVLGPTAMVARLFGADYLGLKRDGDSFYGPKEPPDQGEERFLRQY